MKQLRQRLADTFRLRISLLSRRLYGEGGVLRENRSALAGLSGQRFPTWAQWRLFPRILSKQEKRIALSLTCLMLVTIALLSWRWFKQHTALIPAPGGEYIEAIVGLPRTANPLLASSDAEQDLVTLTSCGLLGRDENGALTAVAAASWRVSPDQRTYTVTLKPDLTWSDGKALTLTDVLFTFASAVEPTTHSPLRRSLKNIKVTQVDTHTIDFFLPEPSASFAQLLTTGLLPAHVWQGLPYSTWLQTDASLKPVGCGPFRFASLVRDKLGTVHTLTLEGNPYAAKGSPLLDRIQLRFYPDTESAQEALRQGSADGLAGLNTISNGYNQSRFVKYDVALPQYTAIFYNPTSGPLKNRAVRQALSVALQRQQLITRVFGGAVKPANSPFVTQDMKLQTGISTYEPGRAQNLMASAGYTRNSQGQLVDKEGKQFTLTLSVVEDDEQLQVASELEQQWSNELGLIVAIVPVPSYRLTDIIASHSYDAILATEVVGLDPDPYPYWHSSQTANGRNLALFQNRAADQLMVLARNTTDPVERLNIYTKLLDIFKQENPATFLYSATFHYLLHQDIKGLTVLVINQPSDRFTNVNLWYKNTDHKWQK